MTKKYDPATAIHIATSAAGGRRSDTTWHCIDLYQTPEGEFYMHEEGWADSPMRVDEPAGGRHGSTALRRVPERVAYRFAMRAEPAPGVDLQATFPDGETRFGRMVPACPAGDIPVAPGREGQNWTLKSWAEFLSSPAGEEEWYTPYAGWQFVHPGHPLFDAKMSNCEV